MHLRGVHRAAGRADSWEMGALRWFVRWREGVGIRLVAFGIVCFVVTALPLVIYVGVGPADGNPIGLGLLLVLGVFVLVGAGGAGLVVMGIESYRRSPER